MRRPLLAFLLALSPAVASAQLPRDARNPTGMVGSIFYAPMHLDGPRVDDGDRRGVGIRIGFRAKLPESLAPDEVRFGVDGSVTVTNFRGLRENKDPYAFSSAELGPTLSLRVGPNVRTYAFWRYGKQTAELLENGKVWNYIAGGATSMGIGFERPFTHEGKGLDVGLQWLGGEFDSRERFDVPSKQDAKLSYHAWRFLIGWSGPMTVSLPWR